MNLKRVIPSIFPKTFHVRKNKNKREIEVVGVVKPAPKMYIKKKRKRKGGSNLIEGQSRKRLKYLVLFRHLFVPDTSMPREKPNTQRISIF